MACSLSLAWFRLLFILAGVMFFISRRFRGSRRFLWQVYGVRWKDLRYLRYLREHNIFTSILSLAGAFFLSLADFTDLADLLYQAENVSNEKICVICAICEKIITSRAFTVSRRKAFVFYLSQMAQISQIIIASGEGSQSKDLRNLRHLRENNISARDNMKQ